MQILIMIELYIIIILIFNFKKNLITDINLIYKNRTIFVEYNKHL